MPQITATDVLLVLAAALTGGAAGYLAGHQAPAPSRPASDAAGWDSLLQELRGLRSELRAAGLAPARAAGPPAAERTVAADPAAPPADRDEQLVTAIGDLAARVDRLTNRQALQDSALRAAAQRRAPDRVALTAAHDVIAADWSTAQRQFHFLTAAEVLRRYGPPTEIRTQAGLLQWCYDFVTTGGDGAWLGLTFADGIVVRVE